MLEACAGSAYAVELRSAVSRLAERLPDEPWVDLQQVADERIIFGARGQKPTSIPIIWHRLEECLPESKQVWMRYYTASRDADSERVLDPPYLLHIYRGH